MQAKFPEVQTCLGPRLHRSAPGTAERVIDCSGGEDINEDTGFLRKADRLVQLMREQPFSRTIIFCNKIETCRKVGRQQCMHLMQAGVTCYSNVKHNTFIDIA